MVPLICFPPLVLDHKSNEGEKVAVVISIADYEQLLEDVEDLTLVAERRDEDRASLAEVKQRLISDGLLQD